MQRIRHLTAAAAVAILIGSVAPPASAASCSPSTPCIRVGDAKVTEGNSGSRQLAFEVTISHSARIFVEYRTADGTARGGTDYRTKSGTVTFESGQKQKTVLVDVFGDTLGEQNETLFLEITKVGGTLSITNPIRPILEDQRGQGTIVNDDPIQPSPPPSACPPSLPNCQEP
jgi:hypothetical protein